MRPTRSPTLHPEPPLPPSHMFHHHQPAESSRRHGNSVTSELNLT